MSTLIKVADEEIVVNSELDGVVKVIADALDEAESTTDERGRKLPRGFRRFDTVDGRELVVNAAQIAFVDRREQAARSNIDVQDD